jgi:UDP-N-acetylglucosamine 2-epimerase (non-hydrolysing)
VFGHTRICVVHGDTVTTLVGTLLARRAGVAVAHLEAGLRSGNLLDPFPEELVRIIVMRRSAICFAPTQGDVENLSRMGLGDRTFALSANTSVEATQYSASRSETSGPAVFTMHRLENLKQKDRLRMWVDAIGTVAQTQPVRVVLHEPTRQALVKHGLLSLLDIATVEVSGLVSHREFVALLASAPFVVVDGGSIQEECAYLGVPTLLWRSETEREHGIGHNVVLSRFDHSVIARFLSDPEPFRRPASFPDTTPSAEVLQHLLAHSAERAGMGDTARRYAEHREVLIGDRPTYSVIIPVHNRPELVRRAVSSALSQTLPPAEIVVIDDGSEPAVSDLPEGAVPVRLLRQANAGVSSARNLGASVAIGSHLAFLDSDDVWLEGHLAEIDAMLRRSPGTTVAYSLARQTASRFPWLPYGLLKLRHLHAWRLGWPSPLHNTTATVVSRDAFEQVGGFHTGLRIREDTDLFLRLAEVGETAALWRITAVMSRQREGLSSTAQTDLDAAKRDYFAVVERQIARLSDSGSVTPRQAAALRRETHRFWAKMYLAYGPVRSALPHARLGYMSMRAEL